MSHPVFKLPNFLPSLFWGVEERKERWIWLEESLIAIKVGDLKNFTPEFTSSAKTVELLLRFSIFGLVHDQ